VLNVFFFFFLQKYLAGSEWLFEGPGTYMPRVEVEQVDTISATILKPNSALKLKALRECTDKLGYTRKAGEIWLVHTEGAYLPSVDEEIVVVVNAFVLTDKTALHVRATRTFKDVFGKERKAGVEWLVTIKDAETYIPGVYEEIVGEVRVITLNNRQYCVVLDPIDAKGQQQQTNKKKIHDFSIAVVKLASLKL
jgi:major vault protein